jgi:linoleoyl-CoA desaturase
VHQVSSTVDFARGNRLLTWYLGGLNFQIEHHLFPHVSHVHYPALSKMVESTCANYGVPYFAYPGFFAALASHQRWLRQLGRPHCAKPWHAHSVPDASEQLSSAS